MTCQRCMKELPTARFTGHETMVLEHTCTPTARWLAMEAEIRMLKDARTPVKLVQEDDWEHSANWECSGCKDVRCWDDGTPEEHGVKFCTSCGHPVGEYVKFVREEEGEE